MPISPTSIQTSFIPKKSFSSVNVTARGMGILLAISLILLIAAVVVSVAVFLNKARLERAIDGVNGLSESLKRAREVFVSESDLLEAMQRFDTKLNIGQELMQRHRNVAPLFGILGDATLKSVRLGSFDYSGGDNEVKLSFQGEARSFEAIALQSQAYMDTKVLKDVVFSGLNPNEKGDVAFGLTISADPQIVSFIESSRPR